MLRAAAMAKRGRILTGVRQAPATQIREMAWLVGFWRGLNGRLPVLGRPKLKER